MTHQTDEVFRILNDDAIPKTVICAWRGMGKSTIAQAKAIHSLLFRQDKYVVYIGSDLKAATRGTENIKTLLMTNPFIQDVFKIQKPMTFEMGAGKFSVAYWVLTDPWTGVVFACVEPRGIMQTNRGFNRVIEGRNCRPTLVILDDLEDDDDVQNEEIREETRVKFAAAVENIINTKQNPDAETNRWDLISDAVKGKPWRFIYVDTLKHQDANIAHLLGNTDWVSRRYAMASKDRNGKYKSEVPELISDAQVERMVEKAIENNLLDVFYREKMCLPNAPDRECYTAKMFQYTPPTVESSLNNDPAATRFIIVDPARTSKKKSAYTAILGVAAHSSRRSIYLRDGINKHLTPKDIWKYTFDMALALNTDHVFVEEDGLNEHLEYEVVNEAEIRGINLTFHWLKARTAPTHGDFGKGKDRAKVARGGTMFNDYDKRRVWHTPKLQNTAFEQQLLQWPFCAKWDALDVIGYIPQALRELEFCFDAEVTKTEMRTPGIDPRAYARMGQRIRDRARAQNGPL